MRGREDKEVEDVLWGGNKISNLYSAGEELRKDSGALSFPSLLHGESVIHI